LTTVTGNSLICHINLAAGFRGGERQTELLIRTLQERGWEQRLVARRSSELSRRCADIENLQRVEVSSNPIAAMLAARGAAITHAHEARAVYAAWLSSLVAGVPYLLTRRVDNPFNRSRLRDAAYHRADEVICLSDAIVRRVVARYPSLQPKVIPSAHAALAHSGCDRDAVRQRFPGKTIVGHVGALVQRHKGQRTIIDAARLLARSHPDFLFVLVGGGEDEALLRAEASGLENVEFAGDVNNVADYLAAFDLFVFPSLHEGLGSSLLDAMSFGLPIVASNVGGISEIVDDGVNGILIAPNDSAAFIDALHRITVDTRLRGNMREANLRKAAEFNAERMGSAYEKVYRSILQRQTKS
jgi:glycosyltransferase involved in cell wall biosynthesis